MQKDFLRLSNFLQSDHSDGLPEVPEDQKI